MKDWYIQIGSSPTYGIGTGVFIDPDFGQTQTITTSTMPAWLTFNSGTKTFSAASASNIAPFVNHHLTVTLTATDDAVTPNTATKTVDVYLYDVPTCTAPAALSVTKGVQDTSKDVTADFTDSGSGTWYTLQFSAV